MRDKSKSSPAKKSGRELADIAKAMVKVSGKKTFVKTIDCTPDWVGLVPLFIEWIQNGNQKQYEEAKRNIMQMAQISDSCRKNKSLFMASEDMLEALKEADELIASYCNNKSADGSVNGKSIYKIKQAIAKAEGKQ